MKRSPLPQILLQLPWRQAIRTASGASFVVGVCLKALGLTVIVMLSAAALIVLPKMEQADVLRESAAGLIERRLLLCTALLLLANTWISMMKSDGLAAYKYYPLSLSCVACCLQVRRFTSFRYVVLSWLLFLIASDMMQHWKWLYIPTIVLCILALDSCVILAESAIENSIRGAVLLILPLLIGAYLDILFGSIMSTLIYGALLTVETETRFWILLLTVISAAVPAHLLIRIRVRYGYE